MRAIRSGGLETGASRTAPALDHNPSGGGPVRSKDMPGESCRRTDLDGETKIVKPSNETSSEVGLVAAIEVIGAEVVVVDPMLEHVVGRREHRRGDCEDRLLGSAPAVEAEKRARR